MSHKKDRNKDHEKLIKLDLGCGNNPKEGFIGVDLIKFDKVDKVVDLTEGPWPWKDESVLEVNASHFVEHLTSEERILFCNELYRILVPAGKASIITPHWASCRAYGDPTHVWPPVSEFWFYYLNRDWRATQAPHTDIKHKKNGYNCHFDATWGYTLRQDVLTRNQEWQMFAMANYKEACQDIVATLVKKVT
jgi:hypothetical protein